MNIDSMTIYTIFTRLIQIHLYVFVHCRATKEVLNVTSRFVLDVFARPVERDSGKSLHKYYLVPSNAYYILWYVRLAGKER